VAGSRCKLMARVFAARAGSKREVAKSNRCMREEATLLITFPEAVPIPGWIAGTSHGV
jgi:hypothetical protein